MSDLRADVATVLYWDLAIPRYRVTAEVDHGLVTLQGVVERAYPRSCAEAIVRRVPGVIGVRNEIAVRAAQEFSQPTAPA
jgi:BON domain